jgi:hypothetical protein
MMMRKNPKVVKHVDIKHVDTEVVKVPKVEEPVIVDADLQQKVTDLTAAVQELHPVVVARSQSETAREPESDSAKAWDIMKLAVSEAREALDKIEKAL